MKKFDSKQKTLTNNRTPMISKIKMMLILFLGCSPILMNSQSLIDSLENELKTAKGAHRAEALYMLSWEYRFSDKDKALLYGEEGLKLAKELKDSVSIGSAMNSIAEAYLNAGNFEEAEKITKEELPYARATPKKKNLLGALTRLGTINYRRGKFDDALVYQLEVMREVEKMDNPDLQFLRAKNRTQTAAKKSPALTIASRIKTISTATGKAP